MYANFKLAVFLYCQFLVGVRTFEVRKIKFCNFKVHPRNPDGIRPQ